MAGTEVAAATAVIPWQERPFAQRPLAPFDFAVHPGSLGALKVSLHKDGPVSTANRSPITKQKVTGYQGGKMNRIARPNRKCRGMGKMTVVKAQIWNKQSGPLWGAFVKSPKPGAKAKAKGSQVAQEVFRVSSSVFPNKALDQHFLKGDLGHICSEGH